MRHRNNRLKKLTWWAQKHELRIRNLMTSLIQNGQIKTTSKKARILKSEADKFLWHLVTLSERYEDNADVVRLSISYVKGYINTESDGKKVISELVPRYKEQWRTTWFVQSYKLWFRKWDWAEEVLVKLI